MLSNIKCCKPTILRNPYLKELLLNHRYYHMNGHDFHVTDSLLYEWSHFFPVSKFNPFVNGVTEDTLDDYYVTNETGSRYPMYIIVPCGKCSLCKQKKSREWEFRAICETQSSSNIPYFVTLTYDNAHLPSDGVNKRDIQLFLKRLRINLFRSGYDDQNLRYFCCAEYGSNTHRPHYHLILWNFPHMYCLQHEILFIENAWGNGFILCKPSNNGSISYCMKYMRKDQYIPPGKNPGFFLSSRKNGGIGAQTARDYLTFYRTNPDVTSMEIVDKFSGQLFKSFIPSYFVRLWFPTMSLLIKKDVRDAYSNMQYWYTIYKHMMSEYNIDESRFTCVFDDMYTRNVSKFSFLPLLPLSISSDQSRWYCDGTSFSYNVVKEGFLSACSILDACIPDADYIEFLFHIKNVRLDCLNRLFENVEKYDIESLVYELEKSKNLSKKREIL